MSLGSVSGRDDDLAWLERRRVELQDARPVSPEADVARRESLARVEALIARARAC